MSILFNLENLELCIYGYDRRCNNKQTLYKDIYGIISKYIWEMHLLVLPLNPKLYRDLKHITNIKLTREDYYNHYIFSPYLGILINGIHYKSCHNLQLYCTCGNYIGLYYNKCNTDASKNIICNKKCWNLQKKDRWKKTILTGKYQYIF